MSKQMTLTEPTPAPVVVASNPMQLIQSAVANGMDPDQLGKLMDLQERWERNNAAKAFADALAKFQSECPVIIKRRPVSLTQGGSTSYHFAAFDDVMRVAQPILAANGLSVSFSSVVTESGMITVDCFVRCGTHVEKTSITLPIPAEMRVNATQKMGAARAYAKRYGVVDALNIIISGEDTDAKDLTEKPISDDQKKRLHQLLTETGSDVAKFLAWGGVDELALLPASKFKDAEKMLMRKLATT